MQSKLDPLVGISIASLAEGQELSSFGTRMEAGKKVSCHAHSKGEEWYFILAGEGDIFLADVDSGTLSNRREHKVNTGDIFCIQPNTAHQLRANSQLDLIFICPKSHLETDRVVFPDLC